MATRIPTILSLSTALLAGWIGQTASANEEIVVDGTEAVARIEAQREMFRAELDEYMRSLEEAIKARLEDAVKPAAPKLEVAISENPIRG